MESIDSRFVKIQIFKSIHIDCEMSDRMYHKMCTELLSDVKRIKKHLKNQIEQTEKKLENPQ